MGIRGRLLQYRIRRFFSRLSIPSFNIAWLKWVLIGLAGLLILAFLIFALIWVVSQDSDLEYVVSDTVVYLQADGYYYKTCDAGLNLQQKLNGQWLDVGRDLPEKTQFKLDGLVNRNGNCHVEICVPVVDTIAAPLSQIRKTGTEAVSSQEGFVRPIYRTEKLFGEIRMEYTYYTDSFCENAKVFEEVFLV